MTISGAVTSQSQRGHALSFTYNALSQLLTAGQPLGTVSYEYDAAGRCSKLTYPGGYYVNYDYLVTGEAEKIRENGHMRPSSRQRPAADRASLSPPLFMRMEQK